MTTLDQVLSLVQQTLDDFDTPGVTASAIVRRAIRVARLRNDFDNLWWLELEMTCIGGDADKLRRAQELWPHYTNAEFQKRGDAVLSAFIERRQMRQFDVDGVPDRKATVCALPLPEIESRIAVLSKELERSVPTPGLHSVDLYFNEKQNFELRRLVNLNIEELVGVRERIQQRVYAFLSQTEQQLVYGQVNADIFERNRRYVGDRLAVIAPDVVEKFTAAYRRLSDGSVEARSHALSSCRRVLKSLADQLYPATNLSAVGLDGKEHKLTDDRYVARLWQYAFEQVGGRTAGKVVLAEVARLGTLIDRLYDLDSKGVHDDVSQDEVEQCAIQTYLVVGDLLRLSDRYQVSITELEPTSSRPLDDVN